MSVAKYSQAGEANQPSPSIWSDCRGQLLNDLGLGAYMDANFMGVPTGTVATTVVRPAPGGFQLECDDDTVLSGALPVDEHSGRLDIETDGDDNDAAALHGQIGIGLEINSGKKVWFETRVALGAAADQGFFAGLVEEDGLTRDVVADNGTDPVGQSLFGFWVDSADTGEIQAVWKLDAGTTQVVLDDITRAAVYTDASGDTAADWPVADTYLKLGLKFDGRETLKWFVNGYEVASITVTDGTHADNVEMGPIVALKTGAGAARSMNISFMRYAYQERT